MHMTLHKSLRNSLMLAAVGTLFAAAAPVQAAMMLTLTTSGVPGSVVILDNNVASGDTQPAVGIISNTSFLYGDFSLTLTFATSNSPGLSTGDILQVTSIDVRNTGSGSRGLDISLSDNNFTNPAGPTYNLASSVAATITGGTVGDSVRFQSYADSSNILNGHEATTGIQSGTLAVSAVIPVSLSTPDVNTLFSSAVPFSISNELTIALSGGAQANVSASTTVTAFADGLGGPVVPEPASLSLLVFAGMGLLSRRRR